jgi:5-methylcytosine-specific restriction protein A
MAIRMLRPGSSLTPAKPSRVALAPLESPNEADYRERCRLYLTARWRKARAAFLDANPNCETCLDQGTLTPATVVDHRDGHAFDDWRDRFWNPAGWQAMCQRCHAAKSAREGVERRRW